MYVTIPGSLNACFRKLLSTLRCARTQIRANKYIAN